MSATKLPSKLGKEPLIDVVCATQFQSALAGEGFLPGLLMQKLHGRQLSFETLAAGQLPQIVREGAPGFKDAPLMSIKVDNQFNLLIGSQWLAVGCQMPYSGWAKFKEIIFEAFGALKDAPFITQIDRHSLKYVDLMQHNGQESLAPFRLEIDIAGRKIKDQATQFRTELVEPPFLHAVTIISSVVASPPNQPPLTGALLDVDTHRIETYSVEDFLAALPTLLEEIHTANKALFFDILSNEGLSKLEPIYD
jgi:uncharacterized protein (TIGR04255 family)